MVANACSACVLEQSLVHRLADCKQRGRFFDCKKAVKRGAKRLIAPLAPAGGSDVTLPQEICANQSGPEGVGGNILRFRDMLLTTNVMALMGEGNRFRSSYVIGIGGQELFPRLVSAIDVVCASASMADWNGWARHHIYSGHAVDWVTGWKAGR